MAAPKRPKPDTVSKPAAAGTTASELAAMQPGEIAAQAKAWDDARSELGSAANAAAAAQVALDGLAADASDEQRHDALVLLAEAENIVRDAEARIRALTLGDILPVGAASATAHGGNASAQPAPAAAEPGLAGGAVRSPVTHTPEGDDRQGGAGSEAGPAGTYRGISREEMTAMAAEQADLVIASVKERIAAGDHDGAMRHLKEEQYGAELMLEVSKLVGTRLEHAAVELGRSKTVWPLENVMYAAQLHIAGGPSFQIEPQEFDALNSIGVVTDNDPHQEHADVDDQA